MNSSPTIIKIAAALVKAQTSMGNAKKDGFNPFFKSHYADLSSVREAVLPLLNANGISALQPTCIIDGKNYVETILLHDSGEFISSFTEIICNKPNDAQSHGSGLSYARRYALSSIINIGAEDDDANAATGMKTEIKSVDTPKQINNLAKEIGTVLKTLLPKPPPTPWHLTTKEQAELVSLIKSSTLDTKSADAAATEIAGAKSQERINQIKHRLLQVQTIVS